MPFHSNVKNLVFDVLSPFYNVLNLKNTYNRFNTYFRQNPEDSTIYEFAVQNNWSLLSKMIDSNDRDYEVNLHGFLSDGVLRNAEVLNALSERIRASRFGSYSSKNSVCIKEFYSKIRQSGMRTYPRTKKDIPYQIQFMFLDAFAIFWKLATKTLSKQFIVVRKKLKTLLQHSLQPRPMHQVQFLIN